MHSSAHIPYQIRGDLTNTADNDPNLLLKTDTDDKTWFLLYNPQSSLYENLHVEASVGHEGLAANVHEQKLQ
jgi:hypothetical protein